LKVHLDTDLGGDIDDICALAMLLCWPQEIQITGITTVGELNGRRAGQVKYVLGLAGRNEIPVAAGADVSQGFYPYELGLPPEERYWPEPIVPVATAASVAVQLLKASIEQGATVIAIGPYTNLFLLEKEFPGSLQNARLFLMGGYVYAPRAGFPQWQPTDDFNVQVDARSAQAVIANSDPTFIPLACAIALGWRDGVEISELPLRAEIRGGALYQQIVAEGKPTRVVTKVDGDKFSAFWLDTVAGAVHAGNTSLH